MARQWCGLMARQGLRGGLLVILLSWSAAAGADDLYRAQTAVTGQGEPNRLIGFAACLEDVLIKASGQLRLAGDKRLAPFKADAAKWVRDFSYRDEKGGKPKNDEQGTRDRSFVLTAEFDEAAVNYFDVNDVPIPPAPPLIPGCATAVGQRLDVP